MLEDLVVSFEGSRLRAGNVAPGGSTQVWLNGRRKGVLSLAFKQTGNPMSGFMLDDFDPRFMRREGFKLMLLVRPNEVERSFEDDDTTTPISRLNERVHSILDAELSPIR